MYISEADIAAKRRTLSKIARRTSKRIVELQKAAPCKVLTLSSHADNEGVQTAALAGIATGASLDEITAVVNSAFSAPGVSA